MAEKVYYTIGEVARIFGVNTSLIRFWEKEFDIIQPHKNKKGNRLFTPEDVDHFHTIYHLVKERGFTLQGAKDQLKMKREEVESDLQLLKTLKELKDFLVEMRNQLDDGEGDQK